MTGGGNFLYPFLDAEETDGSALSRDLTASAEAKATESIELRRTSLAGLAPELDRVASAMAAAFRAGGRLFTFGNGGSATDAAGLAALFASPSAGRPLPARSLVSDTAVLTALANDVGVEVIFSRQLIAHAHPGDIAVGLSTSGGSRNVLQAFAEGRRRGLLTVGLAGYRGGAMATCPDLDHCLAVEGQSVHRTQEAQSALAHALWERVQQEFQPAEVLG